MRTEHAYTEYIVCNHSMVSWAESLQKELTNSTEKATVFLKKTATLIKPQEFQL